MSSPATTRRLLAALVRDGLAEGVREGGALRIRGVKGEWVTPFTGADPTFPHPTELPDPGGDPLVVLDAVGLPYPEPEVRRLREELASAVAMMEIAPRRPTPGLDAPAIAWEQAIVEGHATHPCHKSRVGLSVEQARAWAAEHRGCPEILLVRGAELQTHGPFHELLGLARGVIPIHPGQLPNLRARFPDIEVVGALGPAWAQASLRTVSPVGSPLHLKLALAVQTTSALRTISPQSVANGPVLSGLFARLAPEGLHVVEERAAAGSAHPDPDVAKHLACILRADPETAFPGDRFVVCAALVEHDAAGVPLARAVPLDFDRYARLLLDAVVPMMRDHGIALEAHGQNTLARYRDGGLVGFAVRDFGGVRIHRPTLRASGHELALAPGSAPDAPDIEEVWGKLHHCVIQQHLGELIRVLGLGDTGWAIVRRHVDHLLGGTAAHTFWTAPTAPHKCLLRMRLEGRYRDYLHRPAPNPLFDA